MQLPATQPFKHQHQRVPRGAMQPKPQRPERDAAKVVLPTKRKPAIPNNAHVEVFFDRPWLDNAVKDVQAATSDIVVSTSMYDDWPLHNVLLAALRRNCYVQVFVDAQHGRGPNQGALSSLRAQINPPRGVDGKQKMQTHTSEPRG